MIHRLLFLFLILTMALRAEFPWPLAPMDEQHRVSATFDECRENRDHFHSGTDIPLAQGGAVLSIESGQVTGFDPNGINAWIRVGRYAYVHVTPNPALSVGNYVNQGDVVGWTNDQNHIHLNDGGGASGYSYANSLRTNGIAPFEDPYHPRSPIISFRQDGTDTRFTGSEISGRVDIWAQASDTTDTWSSIDMNNGVYKIGWALYSSDTSAVLEGPYFHFQADNLYNSNYINNLYAPGSSTSTYIHILTNSIYANGSLDCDGYDPGEYVVAVMSADTRNNWDTTYVSVTFTDEDLVAPEPPVFQFAGLNDAGEMTLKWEPPTAADLAGYNLYYSFDGNNWTNNLGPETLTAEMSSYTFSGFPSNSYIHLKLTAVDAAPIPNESDFSDTYGVKMNLTGTNVMVVDGFDRTTGSWTAASHHFNTIFGKAISDAIPDVNIAAASNEWILAGQALEDCDAVMWFVGDESRDDETFSVAEQTIIQNYLTGGGNLFLSGSEIGYDLSAGDATDQAFFSQWLGLNYTGDASGNYSLTGLSLFDGFSATYGSQPYEDDWPDYFTTAGTGQVYIDYGNGFHAGIGNAIVNGELTGKVLTVGFAWETMAHAATRTDFMTRLFDYFDTPVGIAGDENAATAAEYSLSPTYPNPGNAQVAVDISTPNAGRFNLEIFDISGRLIWEQGYDLTRGRHQISWQTRNEHGAEVSSGIYLMKIQGMNQNWFRKVTLIK
ncbi:MAG: T9SS type A sorting domain-containing protein [Candidatus Marinimicrobia bacterium]|nr:T9SS type A sorting domain-containing protein [Candidatus Neomarinimicrobiota bacterium]MCF7840022.1 T9SS type A sorting domain-containing protein [Candidatus Neomarinimicrobiota bacterium]MCF7902134.1 T9SS type A sorting domain-containing protein [Candidatus Neomarinimicrobiota bacterium]